MKRILITLLMAVFFVLTGTEIPRIEPVVFALQNGRMTGEARCLGSWEFENGTWRSSGHGWETLSPRLYSGRKEITLEADLKFSAQGKGAVGLQLGNIHSGENGNNGCAVLYYPAEKKLKVGELSRRNGDVIQRVRSEWTMDLGDHCSIRLDFVPQSHYDITVNGKRVARSFFGLAIFHRSGIVSVDMPVSTARFSLSATMSYAPVVAFGDSITHHCRWQNEVAARLGLSIANCGIAGEGTAAGLERFETDVTALHPRVVVIFEGTNNPKPLSALNDIDRMVQLARKKRIQVVLCELLPRNDSRDVTGFNVALKEYAARQKLPVIDWYHVIDDGSGKPAQKYGGSIHPNQAGVRAMADYVLSRPEWVALLKGE